MSKLIEYNETLLKWVLKKDYLFTYPGNFESCVAKIRADIEVAKKNEKNS